MPFLCVCVRFKDASLVSLRRDACPPPERVSTSAQERATPPPRQISASTTAESRIPMTKSVRRAFFPLLLFHFLLLLHDPVSGVHQSKQEIPKQAFCFYDLFAVINCVKEHDFVLFIHPCRLFRFLPMRFLLLSTAAYRSVVHVFKMKRLCPGGHSRVAL